MHLGNSLIARGASILGNFAYKWTTIEEALFLAIGEERNITRMTNFLKMTYKDFMGQPLELLFNMVDPEVDNYLGRQEGVVKDTQDHSQCMSNHRLLMKYNLLVDIVNNLGTSFSALKDCILKEISKIYFDATKLMDIPAFTEKLITVLEKRSLSTQFRSTVVLKHIPVKAAGFMKTPEDTPEVRKMYAEETKKRLIPYGREHALCAELMTAAKKLAEDVFLQLDDDIVVDNPQMKEAMEKQNQASCAWCLSQNCAIKQEVSKHLRMKRTEKNFGCKILSKKAKFKDILPKSSNTNSDEEDNVKVSTTTTNNPDSVIDEMSRFSEYVEEEEDSHGFKAPALVIGISVTRPPIVKASLPTAAEIMEDTESTNKKCIICLKSNLTMKALKNHVMSIHNILISEPLPAWLRAEKAWDNFLLTHPDYNSENEDCSANGITPNAAAKLSSKLSKKTLRKKRANR